MPTTTRLNEIHFTIADCSLGLALVAQSAVGLRAVLLGDDRDALIDDLRRRVAPATVREDLDALGTAAASIVALIDDPSRRVDLALDGHGTPFQRAVWDTLRTIPSGDTATYADIASRIGKPGSSRAVAQACAANPLAVIVPCHRVIGSDGALSGYRWGADRKRALLDREAEHAAIHT